MLFARSAILSLSAALPPNVVTSDDIENRLRPVYERLHLPAGRLELMSGIHERRFWDPGTRPSRVAAAAGEKALAAANIAREKIGCLIHASVCRDFMEPATASVVHNLLGLEPGCMIFDLSNACLGVLSAMVQMSMMLDHGVIEAGLIVSGEVAEPLYAATLKKLLTDTSITRQSVKNHFASLTIGSGAVAVVMANHGQYGGHRLLGGAALTDSGANRLCREDKTQVSADGPLMATDSEALLNAGCNLAARAWEKTKTELGWDNNTPDRFFTHQVGVAHSRLLYATLGIDTGRDFPTFPRYGNTGSAALPMAVEACLREKPIHAGEKVAFLGIGSGLSSIMLGVEW